MDWREKTEDELTLKDALNWREYARGEVAHARARRDDWARSVRSNRAWERSALATVKRLCAEERSRKKEEDQGDG